MPFGNLFNYEVSFSSGAFRQRLLKSVVDILLLVEAVMNGYSTFRVLLVAFLVLLVLPASAQTWELVWADEFDGAEVDR